MRHNVTNKDTTIDFLFLYSQFAEDVGILGSPLPCLRILS